MLVLDGVFELAKERLIEFVRTGEIEGQQLPTDGGIGRREVEQRGTSGCAGSLPEGVRKDV
jgi:hypothetical protein